LKKKSKIENKKKKRKLIGEKKKEKGNQVDFFCFGNPFQLFQDIDY